MALRARRERRIPRDIGPQPSQTVSPKTPSEASPTDPEVDEGPDEIELSWDWID